LPQPQWRVWRDAEKKPMAQKPPMPVVFVTPAVSKEIVEWDEYTGRLAAPSRVEVRARVSGFLQSVHFKDGDMVKDGALLFVDRSRPYAAKFAGPRPTSSRRMRN